MNFHNLAVMNRFINISLIQLIICVFFLTSCAHRETYTVVVSLDAFRSDYPEIFETPGLDEIAAEGISCVLEPSYPASTFPNHYTIATGLVPDHHGIVNGSFWNPEHNKIYSMGDSLTRYNPNYYGGEPIWVTAEKAGLKTGNIYWVGSDIAIQGILPTYGYPWWEKPHLTYEQRADETVKLLSLPKSERPDLVMVYFDDPDLVSHKYGPLAPETKKMVAQLDSIVINMHHRLKKLPYGDRINMIIVSDHGMTEISEDRFIDWDDYLNPSWYDHILGTTPTNIYAKENYVDSIVTALADVEHISVWRHGEVPENLNYGTSGNCGNVIVAPDLGWQFAGKLNTNSGAHGYSPEEQDMKSIFIASGPYFEKHRTSTIKSIRNIDIYSLLADILGIKPVKTDGSIPDFYQNR